MLICGQTVSDLWSLIQQQAIRHSKDKLAPAISPPVKCLLKAVSAVIGPFYTDLQV